MGMMNLYREQLKATARSLDQEGLSQGAIGEELGVPQRTISDWLKVNDSHHRQAESTNNHTLSDNRLSASTAPRYLVVCQSVEKFRPPDGITFPLIIAGFRKNGKNAENEEILDLYLEGWTEAEIGKKVNLSKRHIYRILEECQKGIDAEMSLPDPPQIGDVWLFSNCDDA